MAVAAKIKPTNPHQLPASIPINITTTASSILNAPSKAPIFFVMILFLDSYRIDDTKLFLPYAQRSDRGYL
jgi:hypothetical protein